MAEERSMAGKVWDYMKDRVFPETGEMLMQKTAQGAAEISQALNSESNAYVPYGSAQQPLEIEGPQVSYQETLRDASQRGGHEQQHEMEM